MRNIFLSTLVILGILSTVAGATRATFKDTETSIGNTFAAGTLDFTVGVVSGRWNFPFINKVPGDITGIQRLRMLISNDSIQPNHLEIDIDTHDFSAGPIGTSTKDAYLKQIEVKQLYLEDINRNVVPNDWHWVGLMNKIDDTKDGNIGFKSLYDLEQSGILDNITILQKEIEFRIELGLPTTLPDTNDSKYQGNSVEINFEFGMAQTSSQTILTN